MKPCRECNHEVSEQAVAQFAFAWSLIAQIGLYLHKGAGQLVFKLAEFF